MSISSRLLRSVYAQERIPATLRWSMTAATMRTWIQLLRRELRRHLDESADELLTELVAQAFRRRYAVLCEQWPHLRAREHDARALPLVIGGLYQLSFAPRRRWILDGLGGGPRSLSERLRGFALLRPISHEERWSELTVHLGELLIVLTEGLKDQLPRAPAVIGKMCFDMGVEYAKEMNKRLELPEGQPVANAVEILRASEYLFRVNETHKFATDEEQHAGHVIGSACHWYPRPGWNGVHCGIFGQFQAGVCSVFELDYSLTRTIPRHGGDHCRVDFKPVKIRVPRGKTASCSEADATRSRG